MVRIPFMGGRGSRERGGDLTSLPAGLDPDRVRVDPFESQVAYVARELKLADGMLADEFRQLHPDMDDDSIQDLVRRVLSIRHPEQAEGRQ